MCVFGHLAVQFQGGHPGVASETFTVFCFGVGAKPKLEQGASKMEKSQKQQSLNNDLHRVSVILACLPAT